MGFGFGTKMNQYSIKPKNLPKDGLKDRVSFFRDEEKQLLLDCYARIAERTNGMVDRSEAELNNTLIVPQNKIAVYKRDGKVEGYAVFMFKKASQDNAMKNDIIVKEFLYENTEALRAILTFFSTQEDQINSIVFNTLDEDFHHMLVDPRNGTDNILTSVYHESNLQGVGVMYRVTDPRLAFEALKEHNFNGQSCRLKLHINDTLIKENNGSIIVHFRGGKAELTDVDEFEAEIYLDIADFSSLLVGAVSLKSLIKYGIARISDNKYTEVADNIFRMPEKPICLALF